MHWINLAGGKGQWLAVANKIMNLSEYYLLAKTLIHTVRWDIGSEVSDVDPDKGRES
jgi:hypothetical protein